MVLRNVAKTFSLEEQRQEINEIAVDLDAVNTTLANWNAGNWDTAYSWGDHAQAGYWVDVPSDRTNWNTAYGWGDHAQVGYWVDVPSDRTNWNTAYGWGDHAQAGYALSTALTNSANWDTAYSWGDHALVGYLTSYTETDPVFTASAASGIAAGDITNWDTAYGWGDHSTEGYAVGTIPTPGGISSGTGTAEDPIIESIQLNAGSGNFGGDSLLVWNTTDNRLGIGVADPKNEVHILKGSDGGDVSLRVTNQSSVDAGTTASIYLGTSLNDTFNTFYIRAFRDGGATHLGYSDPDAVDHDPNIILPSAGGLEFGTQTDTETTGSTKLSATLDHYEEGTWTPQWGSTTGSITGVTYDVQSGWYTRIGRVVYVSCRLRSTATDTSGAGGGLLVTGLPFVARTPQGTGAGAAYSFFDFPAGTINITTEVRENTTQFYAGLYTLDNGSFGNIGPGSLQSSGSSEIRVSFFYMTDS